MTSKIWLTYFRPDRVPICAEKILRDLQLEYIDLLLLHWLISLEQQDQVIVPLDPNGKAIDGGVDFVDAYHALEKIKEQGLALSIGVSNFNIDQLKRLLSQARIKPVTNQIEAHPFLVQPELKSFCEAQGIVITAYSPLGNPGSILNLFPQKDALIKNPVVLRTAKKYNKNSGQILIKYQV